MTHSFLIRDSSIQKCALNVDDIEPFTSFAQQKRGYDPAQGVKVSTAMVAVTGVFAAEAADAFYVANVNAPSK